MTKRELGAMGRRLEGRIEKVEHDLGLRPGMIGRSRNGRDGKDTDVAIAELYHKAAESTGDVEALGRRIEDLRNLVDTNESIASKALWAILDYFGLEWKKPDPQPSEYVLVKKQKAKA